MKKNYIINHTRFQKRYDENTISNYLPSENRIVKFPKYFKSYYEFFNVYAKKIISRFQIIVYVVKRTTYYCH